MNPVSTLGSFVLNASKSVSGFGRFLQFSLGTVADYVRKPYSLRHLFEQMEFVGNKSVFIVMLSAVLVGAIFGLQLGYIFRIFGTESMIGAAAGIALAREMAPVFTAFLVTGRAGSAMAAEIGSMRVGEQLDALRAMSISPRSYLVMPRVLASVIMLPLLSGIFLLVGMIAAMVVAIYFFQVPSAIYLDKVAWVCKWSDLMIGLQKAAFFGLVYSSISCFFGFYTKGGAEGVGRATTQSVVISLFIIILADFVLSFAFFDINDKILN